MPGKAPDIDYYEVLGVDPAASDDDLRRAWKQLALKWHPDRAGAAGTEFIFQRIADAYAVLCDPQARMAYDRKRPRRSSATHATQPSPSSATTPARGTARAPGVLLMNLSRPLDALLALGVARVLPDGVIELAVDKADATEGGMIRISMRVDIHCDACNVGVVPHCGRCGGSRVANETYSAWLALRPGVVDGTVLRPSAQLPGVIREVRFRVRRV
jgi:DnaJ-class molecular chaperone